MKKLVILIGIGIIGVILLGGFILKEGIIQKMSAEEIKGCHLISGDKSIKGQLRCFAFAGYIKVFTPPESLVVECRQEEDLGKQTSCILGLADFWSSRKTCNLSLTQEHVEACGELYDSRSQSKFK